MSSYNLARQFFLRGLGALYLICASILILQGPHLIGEAGLSPIPKNIPNPWNYPSLLLFFPSDATIYGLGIAMGVGALTLLAGICNWPLLAILYICQLSLVNGGGLFYGFGWETMMCEMTFLALFISHPWKPKMESYPVGSLNMMVFWLLLWKLMVGAGLIKIRGDACWTDFTCMDVHYETQPNPHWISWYFHNLPFWFHRFETGFNHFVELLVPFGLFGPKILKRISGLLLIFFQMILIASGNLAFINWQTLVLAMVAFDDEFLKRLWFYFRKAKIPETIRGIRMTSPPRNKYILSAGIAVIVFLNLPVLRNLVSPSQSMNESYSRWHLVNTYGLFGSISKERYEIIISATRDQVVTPQTQWQEYEFYCKPGKVDRRPCWITPYHLRLDWQLWFSAMRPELGERWLSNLAEMMLRNDVALGALGIANPFKDQAAPVFIKMDLYRYRFTSWDEGNSNWWRREFVKPYMLPARFN